MMQLILLTYYVRILKLFAVAVSMFSWKTFTQHKSLNNQIVTVGQCANIANTFQIKIFICQIGNIDILNQIGIISIGNCSIV